MRHFSPSTTEPRRLGALRRILATSATLGLVTAVQVATPSQAAPAFCAAPVGAVVNTWVGAANDGLWVTGSNWSLGRAPNMNDASTGYVCINANRTVALAAGQSAELLGIDIASGTTLDLQLGSMLYLYGSKTASPSYLRTGSLTKLAGVLGGPGYIELDGKITWTSSSMGASTMSSRRCGVAGTCTGPLTQGGMLLVGNTGFLAINGRGVNLLDSYRIVVRGTVRLMNSAYIAADRGTSMEITPKVGVTGKGLFDIANNGGWYEGYNRWGLPLHKVVNGGVVRKSVSTGTAIIDGDYQQTSTGVVQVQAGRLTLPESWVTKATTSANATVGFGPCVTAVYGCQPTATSTETQNGQVTVPATDTSGAQVGVTPDGAGPTGAIGEKVHAWATNLATTASDPAILELRYDSSILAGKNIATIVIQRQPETGGAFLTVPSCLSTGLPPTGWNACVDRRGLATSSRMLGDGDALMVVRTTVFSRWVAL